MNDWHIEDIPYRHWIENVETPSQPITAAPKLNIENDDSWPRISIIMPTYNSPLSFLRAALDSVLAQSYPKWQLCIADDASDQEELYPLLEQYSENDPRIFIKRSVANKGIATTTNSALSLSSGQYIAFLDHDDTLSVHALLLVAEQLRRHTTTQILYSDSDSIDTNGNRSNPFFKPSWNYELFLCQNYLNHLSVYRSDLVKQLGGLREGFEGSQDYDLALRAIEHIKPSQIRHLAKILYHWRIVPTAVSQSNLTDAVRAGRRAVGEHLKRCRLSGSVGSPPKALIYNRINWSVPTPLPTTHIVVYGHSVEQISTSIGEIRATRQADNDFCISEVFIAQAPSNNMPLGEILAAHCSSITEDNICLFAAGVCPLSADWLQRLNAILNRSRVGLVAPKVVNTQGILLSGPLTVGTEAWFRGSLYATTTHQVSRSNDGYFKRLRLDHRASALHGACLMIKNSVLKELGGIDHKLSSPPLLGADLCFKAGEAGYGAIWTPSVRMGCEDDNAKSIFFAEPGKRELLHFEQTWPQSIECDPFYNPNLSRLGRSYQLPN